MSNTSSGFNSRTSTDHFLVGPEMSDLGKDARQGKLRHGSCCEFNSNNVYDRRTHMKNKCERKSDLSVDELRNIINKGFDIFQLYMKMKIQPTEVEDEERIEESIDVFKHYMLNKINE